MQNLFIDIGIGILAGIIDIIPMMVQKLDKHAIVSAFIQLGNIGILITDMKSSAC